MFVNYGRKKIYNVDPRKSLLGEPVTEENLAAFDPVLSGFIRTIRGIKSESKFNEFLEENQFPRFTFSSLRGDPCDLVSCSQHYIFSVTYKSAQ
jgi:hypothetical protein